MRGWLTLDAIPERVNVCINLPDSEGWRAQFLGAILELTKAENWEEHDTLSALEMSDEWRSVFFDFVEGACSMIPVGAISAFAGSSAPEGWLMCDGAAVSRTTYAALFAVIADWYGFGDGSTTFNVPNLVGRVAVMRDAGQTEFDYLGEPGGDKTHTLTIAEMPSHTHIQDAHNHVQSPHDHVVGGDNLAQAGVNHRKLSAPAGSASVSTGSTTAANIATTATNQSTGGGGAHNNMPPYLVLNYIIKY